MPPYNDPIEWGFEFDRPDAVSAHKHTETRYEQRTYRAYCACGEWFSGHTGEAAELVLLGHLDRFFTVKPLTFTLTITLGNDGMQSPADVAQSLADLSSASPFAATGLFGSGEEGTVRDLNGNTVGSWGVK